MGIEDKFHFSHSTAEKAGAAGSKPGPTIIVPARNPAVGFPGASGRGARAARADGAALRVAFLAGFLMATGISRKDAEAGLHDKSPSLPEPGSRQLCRHDGALSPSTRDHRGGWPAGPRQAMTDILTPAQRSALMAKVRSSGNASTELRLVAVFRALGITGWRRGAVIRAAAPRSTKALRASATSGKTPSRVAERGTRFVPPPTTFRVRPDFVFPKLRFRPSSSFWRPAIPPRICSSNTPRSPATTSRPASTTPELGMACPTEARR